MNGYEKPCNQCAHHIIGEFRDYCSGPHIQPSIVSGKPIMELPSARYSGGNGLRRGVRPCGEYDGFHWTPKSTVTQQVALIVQDSTLWLILIIIVLLVALCLK